MDTVQMDGQTILFKGDTFCKAYSINFYNNNYIRINSELKSITDIYYKCNNSRDSWIDYKKAMSKFKDMPYINKIINALSDDDCKINLTVIDKDGHNVIKIPECEYIDYLGYKYKIGSNDGLNSINSVRPIYNIYSKNIKISSKFNEYKNCWTITVDFGRDVRDAIITFNGLNIPFEFCHNSNSKIIYYEDVTRENDFIFPRDNDVDVQESNFNDIDISDVQYKPKHEYCHIIPFIWQNVKVVNRCIKPIKQDREWIVFDPDDIGFNGINGNYLLFYNNVMYFFENNDFKDNYIRFSDIEIGNVSNFDINRIYLMELRDTKGDILKQQKLVGFFNESTQEVYFSDDISNAIITYNGIEYIKDKSYIIKPNGRSAKFVVPHEIYNLNNNESIIDMDSEICAINFYTGNLINNENIFHKNQITRLANDIIREYKARINSLTNTINKLRAERNLVVDDYEQTFEITKDNTTEFVLEHVPQDNSIEFYVNGIKYEENVYWMFDNSNNRIIWTYTEENNGFNIDIGYHVVAVYDYDTEGGIS